MNLEDLAAVIQQAQAYILEEKRNRALGLTAKPVDRVLGDLLQILDQARLDQEAR